MKTFNNFGKAFKWTDEIIKEGAEKSLEVISKQVYEDSKEFIYIDTLDMYESGEYSDFKGGFVLIKAPQVRWLYYTDGITPSKNMKATPMWFEVTKNKNKTTYAKMIGKTINRQKGR